MSEEVHRAAKLAAVGGGVTLRAFVEAALAEACEPAVPAERTRRAKAAAGLGAMPEKPGATIPLGNGHANDAAPAAEAPFVPPWDEPTPQPRCRSCDYQGPHAHVAHIGHEQGCVLRKATRVPA